MIIQVLEETCDFFYTAEYTFSYYLHISDYGPHLSCYTHNVSIINYDKKKVLKKTWRYQSKHYEYNNYYKQIITIPHQKNLEF